MSSAERRWSGGRQEKVEFPPFRDSSSSTFDTIYEELPNGSTHNNLSSPRSGKALFASHAWMPRQVGPPSTTFHNNLNGNSTHGHSHEHQKSLGDAIHNIRTRRQSVTANAQEIAEALKAPLSWQLVMLCVIWYASSALTNTSSKSILNAYPKPITLTIVQFAFVSFWCFVCTYISTVFPAVSQAVPALRHGLRYPSREVIQTTLPLALFQLGGHVLSSTATQQIPVSLVHTIKGLSPLFTVLAYRVLFGIEYSRNTYLSLIPLTLGVIMACSVEFSGNLFGILCALIAALIFVSQNIFSKRLFNEAARAEADAAIQHTPPKKLDKLNLLFYCSTLAFILTFPLWIWTDGFTLIGDLYADGSVELSNKPYALDHGRLALEFVFNGIFHFGQNIIAFILLSMVSPVTYSVASLIKRVFVITAAILWFGNTTTTVQACGIGLTFIGLYMYDRTSDAARADRKAKTQQMSNEAPILPLTTPDLNSMQNGHADRTYSSSSHIAGDEKRE